MSSGVFYDRFKSLVALGGEPAVPCNLQPALAGRNSHFRVGSVAPSEVSGVDPRVPRKGRLRTGSGLDGSSPKEFSLCASGKPGGSQTASQGTVVLHSKVGARPFNLLMRCAALLDRRG